MSKRNAEKTHDGLTVLTHETLGELDHGMVGVAIDDALRRASQDLEDRGSDGKPRQVTIKIAMMSVNETDSKVEVDIELKTPPMKSAPTMSQNRPVSGRGRGMAFRSSNPSRTDQPTIEDEGYNGKGDGEQD